MGPYLVVSDAPEWMNLLTGFLVGIGFGISLEQAGFSSSRKLAGMFYGYDTTVIKVFFTAAIVALIGSQLLNYFGLIDMSLVYINPYFVGAAIVGGVIMGAGFIMGGFCPGTGLCALAIGKIDAFIFLLGGLAGAILFAELFPYLETLYYGSAKGPVLINEWLGVTPGQFALLLVTAAVSMFWLAEKAEKRFARKDITEKL